MTRNWITMASRTLRTFETSTERPRRRGAGFVLESLEVRWALSSVSAAPVPADLNPHSLPPGFAAEFRSLTPEITVTKTLDAVSTPNISMRNAGGGPDLVFRPDPIYLNYNAVNHFSVSPDILGGHIGTSSVGDRADTAVAGQHGKPMN